MQTFSQKPEATQQATSPAGAAKFRSHAGQSHEVHSILHPRRSIENHAVDESPRSTAEGLDAVSPDPNSPDIGHDVRRIPVKPRMSGTIQMKRTTSEPGDPYEQEADGMAERMMRMPEPKLHRDGAFGGACTK
jgi:hypothetical protein